MSVILTLRGVTFNNPDLPTIPRVYRDGMIVGFRPTENASDLVDLSGNGVTFVTQGSPGYTPNGILVDNTKGIQTDAGLPESFTLISAFQLVYETENPSSIQKFFGNQRIDTSTSLETGSSLVAGLFAATPSNVLRHAIRISRDPSTAVNYSGEKITPNVPSNPFSSGWQWVAYTYDNTSKQVVIYQPSKSSVINQTAQAASVPSLSNPICLGYSPGAVSTATGEVAIAEALAYNRVLSPAEIDLVFSYSSGYLASRGITLDTSVYP